jgi:hypothetical protein
VIRGLHYVVTARRAHAQRATSLSRLSLHTGTMSPLSLHTVTISPLSLHTAQCDYIVVITISLYRLYRRRHYITIATISSSSPYHYIDYIVVIIDYIVGAVRTRRGLHRGGASAAAALDPALPPPAPPARRGSVLYMHT